MVGKVAQPFTAPVKTCRYCEGVGNQDKDKILPVLEHQKAEAARSKNLPYAHLPGSSRSHVRGKRKDAHGRDQDGDARNGDKYSAQAYFGLVKERKVLLDK